MIWRSLTWIAQNLLFPLSLALLSVPLHLLYQKAGPSQLKWGLVLSGDFWEFPFIEWVIGALCCRHYVLLQGFKRLCSYHSDFDEL